MCSIRSILKIRWQDKVTNLEEVLDRAETTNIQAMILKAQFHWTGHVIQMDDSGIPKELLFGELSQGKMNQGRPQNCYNDCVKTSIVFAGLNPKQLEVCMKHWVHWCTLTKKAHADFESLR